MMRYRTISILFSLLVYCKVNANEQEEQHCRGRPAYFYPNATRELINVRHDGDYDYCWMIFAPDDDYQVRIKFSNFSLTRGYDFLEIGDRGDDEISSNSPLATFSGGNLPNDVISSSRGMWMKLSIQKHIISHRPPNITFSIQAEKRKVDINLTCPTASPYNLSYPTHNGNYTNNGYRLWRVTTELPCAITMMMTSLWLEEGRDFVFLREDGRAPFSRPDWSNFTAQREPWFLSQYPYRTKGSNLTIIFTSDFSNEKPGFTLQLVANLSDGTIVKDTPSKPTTPTTSPTENQTRTFLSSSLQPIETIGYQDKRNETKFYLIVTGIHVIAIAILVLLLILVVRCLMPKINTRTAPIPRSGSTTNSLGRFFNSLRRNDETSSWSLSFRTSSSGSFSSGRSRFSSSLYSGYTSSSSSCRSYRISTLFSSHFDKDSLPALRNTPSESQMTSFHPKFPQDKCVVDVSEGTSSQSEGDNVSRRISWRMIRNAFWNGSSRSPASSFRSTSIQQRVTRGSTGSSVLQDSESVDPMDISSSISSTDSESAPVILVAQKNSSQPMNYDGKFEAERRGGNSRNQPETLSIEQVDESQMYQVVEKKVSHIYFKGFNRLSSSFKLPNSSDRPWTPKPPRRRHDNNSTPMDTATTKRDGCHPRIQFETLTKEQEIPQMGQAVEKKVNHTYFKGFSGLSSRFMLPNVSGRPLPPIPVRHSNNGKTANILTDKRQVSLTNVQFESNEDIRGHQEETLHGYDESAMSSDSELKDLYASIKKPKPVKSTFTSNGM